MTILITALDQLEENAKTFRWYEELHRAKPDHEKADQNKEFAEKSEQAALDLYYFILDSETPEARKLMDANPGLQMKARNVTLIESARILYKRKNNGLQKTSVT